ncbi:hypothetical protein ABZ912_26070 [Nonomuraea angiospora]|uniref:hypothetical protein n=1 Tax=Nonomuraea angiospora TaxID=46172 RepID=UPI0033F4D460
MGTVMATYGMSAGYRVVAAVVLAGGVLVTWWRGRDRDPARHGVAAAGRPAQ